MTIAYFVYTFVLFFLFISTSFYNKLDSKYRAFFLFMILLTCSFILGLRYDVGTDYRNYKDIYMYQDFSSVEVGYALFNKILHDFGLPFPWIFITVVFLQLYFFVKGVENLNSRYVPLTLFFYCTTLYLFLSLNVLRQTLAFSIFVYSIKYIINKQFIKYTIVLVFASTVHKSSLILLPFYLLLASDWLLKHRILQIIAYLMTYIMSISLSDLIWANFEILALISGYSDYADSISVISEIQWAKEGGIGVYLWMLIDIWVILYFSKKRKLPIMKYDIAFYNLYYIGLLLSNIIAGTYFDRVNIYFQNFRIIIYAIFFSNIFISNNRFLQKTFSVTILIVLLVFFYMGISNKASMCAPYQFISI